MAEDNLLQMYKMADAGELRTAMTLLESQGILYEVRGGCYPRDGLLAEATRHRWFHVSLYSRALPGEGGRRIRYHVCRSTYNRTDAGLQELIDHLSPNID